MYSSSLGMLIIILAVFFIIFNKKRVTALLVLDICLTILVGADMLYFRYFSNAITIPVLVQIGLLSSVGDGVSSLFKPTDLLLILDIPIMIFGMIFIHKLGINKIHVVKRLIISVCVIGIGLVAIIIPLKNTSFIMASFDKNVYIKSMGILYFHEQDVVSFIKDNLFKNKRLTVQDTQKIQSYYDTNKPTAQMFKGIAKGKNVIILQIEALQQFLINKKMNGKEITPNLNTLIKDSLYFDNVYYQAGRGKTSDAEFVVNNSLYPVSEGAVYFKFPTNTYHTLPKILKESGYASDVFHAYIPSFYNRTVVYRNFGFKKFYSKTDFKIDKVVGMGLDDKSFYKQTLDKLSVEKQPYYGFVISLSSHYPFGDFENYKFNVGKLDGTFLGNYIKAENYGDSCIGYLIDELKRRNMYNNTLLVLYGDHFGIPRLEAGNELTGFMKVKNNDFEWTKLQRVPLIIHYPGLKNGKTNSITAGQVDILPTVANLLGVNAPYALGKDLLNTKNGYAVLRDSTVITDEYMYFPISNSALNIKTEKPVYSNISANKKYLNSLDISDIIIHKDAFAKWILK
jgi:phosphoglycerol transferase MdoB-like AlkP superfamily enzyme